VEKVEGEREEGVERVEGDDEVCKGEGDE